MFGSQYCTTRYHDAPVTVQGVTEEPLKLVYPPREGLLDPQVWPQHPFWGHIVMYNGSASFWTVKKWKLTVFKALLYDINMAIGAKDLNKQPLEENVPKQYHEFLIVCSQVLADELPLHQPGIDPGVWLKEGETPLWRPLYFMSRADLIVHKE